MMPCQFLVTLQHCVISQKTGIFIVLLGGGVGSQY